MVHGFEGADGDGACGLMVLVLMGLMGLMGIESSEGVSPQQSMQIHRTTRSFTPQTRIEAEA